MKMGAVALLAAATWAVPGTASATCRPEDKVPCEVQSPIRELTEDCAFAMPADHPEILGVCDL